MYICCQSECIHYNMYICCQRECIHYNMYICCQSEGKAHFGCEELEGVELENQGGEGTALQHWEKRMLGVS